MGTAEDDAAQAAGCLNDWIVRACPDGLWVLDARGRTTFGNARMAQMLGVEHDEIVGFSAYDALDERDGATLRRHLATIGGTSTGNADLELCLRSAAGREVWARIRHAVLTDGSGAFRGSLHRVTESTQRQQIEELVRREGQFVEAQRLTKVGSWDIDVVHGARAWSPELFRVYGLDTTFEPSYEAFLDRVHPDDRGVVAANMREALAGDAPFEVEFRLIPAVGELKWIRGRGRATRDAAGNVVRMQGTSQDITESKEHENALAFLSAMARAANGARTLREVVASADALARTSAQWPALVISVPESAGSRDLVHLDIDGKAATEELRQAAREVAVKAAAERRIVQLVGPAGTILIGGAVVSEGRVACVLVSDTQRRSSATPADLDVLGQVLTMLGNVAEREWTAAELAAARDQALSASTAKSEFLATMSHEIRTPLNGVIGLTELLSSTELTPHQRRLAAGVDQAGRTLLALVNDILDLSKIEAGRLELEAVDFDLRAVLEQSASLVSDIAREKHLELVVSSAVDVPDRVRGDPVRLGQVITNLAANAVKFTSAGEVAIRATVAPGSDGPTELRVEVTDTGIGVAPEVESRLFEAFTQADTSTTRQYGGTGLGLAISRRIVSAMGGEIGVRSQLGAGSTFWFNVRLEAAVNDGPSRDAAREKAVAGLRVLIVDDNETNRFILSEKLAAWNVVATAVESAYEALVELETGNRQNAPYDIVLLDYMMPGADGEQLARSIRAEPRHARTRLALLSSAMEPTAEFLTAAGIDTFLSKPVLASPLLDTLVALGGGLDLVAARPVSVPDERPVGVSGRVLVVEDNPVNQLVAEGMLERLGYSVVMADDGAAGVAAFSNDVAGFDLILMDCQMPVMDGYAATRAIRDMRTGAARIPVIAMTAAAVADERERCLAAGMDDFLLKPVDGAILHETLQRWIRQRQVWVSEGSADEPMHAAGEPTPPEVFSEVVAGLPELQGLAVLDRDRIGELLSTGAADLPLVVRIVERFGTRAAEDTVSLAAAVQVADQDEVVRIAHGLRGSAANVGLVRLARLCEVVELEASGGVLPGPATVFGMEDEVAAAVTELERYARDVVADTASGTAQAGPGDGPDRQGSRSA